MSSKTVLQIIIFLFILLILGFVFNKYFKIKEPTVNQNINIPLNKDSSKSEFSNLLKDVNYSTADLNGNKYEIYAKSGEMNIDNPNLILMKGVIAKITLNNNNEEILIKSDNAKYNNLNYETNFFENINVLYNEHKIVCNYMNLDVENNFLTLYEDLVYSGSKGNVNADRAEINLYTKDMKIFMDDQNKNVKINISGT